MHEKRLSFTTLGSNEKPSLIPLEQSLSFIHETTIEDKRNDKSDENNRILALCFCSLAVTCTESQHSELTITENKKNNLNLIRGHEINEEEDLDYVHLTRIPSNIARIFWSELLGLNTLTSTAQTGEYYEEKKTEDDHYEGELRLSSYSSRSKEGWNTKKEYWREFITEEERSKFIKKVESQTRDQRTTLDKIRKELALNNDNLEETNNNFSHAASSLSEFFRNELSTVCSPPSFDDGLLLNDDYFQHIRDSLLNSQDLEIAVKEKEVVGFIENQESYEGLNNLNYFLDEYSIAHLKEFFNPRKAWEYFKPIVSRANKNEGDHHQPAMRRPSLNASVVNMEGLLQRVTSNHQLKQSVLQHPKKLSKRRNSLTYKGSQNRCVQMLNLPQEDGGFAIRIFNSEIKHSFSSTFQIWNHIMAEACLKLYNPELSFKDGKSFSSVLQDSSNSNSFVSDAERRARIDGRTSNKDDTFSYVLKMIPAHLMRSKRINEAVELLQSFDFLFSRLCVLGPEKVARHLRKDCEEIRIRLTTSDKTMEESLCLDFVNESCIDDPKRIIIGLFMAFKEYYLDEYAPMNDVDTLTQGKILHGIGWTIEKMGWKSEALKFYHFALDLKNKSAELSLVSVMHTLSSMSSLYLASRKYEEAMYYLEEKLALQKVGAASEESIIKTYKSMAMIYGMFGKYESSVFYYEKALLIEMNNYGETNIEIYDTYNCLALVYVVMENHEKAISCFEKTLKIAESNLGENHAKVATCHFNLGKALFKVRNHSQAIFHLSKALVWRTYYLPNNHEDTAKALHILGSVYMSYDVVCVDKAISCFEDALQITRVNHGSDHEECGRRLLDLAAAYKKHGDIEKALKSKVKAVSILKINYGITHDLVVNAVKDLGFLYRDQGMHHQALFCFKEVLHNLKNQKSSTDDVNASPEKSNFILVADMLHEIGHSYYKTDFYDSALENFEKAYHLRLHHLGKDHLDTAETQFCLGLTHFQRENDDKALKYFNLALNNQQTILGKHERVADTLYNRALVHKNLFDYTSAISDLSRAHKIQESLKGQNNAKVANIKYLIAIILSDIGKCSYALPFLNDAAVIYKKIGFRESHPEIVSNTTKWIYFLKDKLHEREAVSC